MKQPELMTRLELLKHYYDQGWSLIPIKKGTKKPAVDWKQLQHQRACWQFIESWEAQFQQPDWAVITGKVSGLFIVDCDSLDALQQAEDLGLTNGCSVKTPHGHHFYFMYPDDGKVRKTISGYGSPGTYWPQVKGLDARSEGGYALLPPSNGYEWEIEHEAIIDELTEYKDWDDATFEEEQQPSLPVQPAQPVQQINSFSDIDLTHIALPKQGKNYNETRVKFAEIAAQYPDGKIPRGGSGIHDATYRFMSEEALIVGIGPELESAGRKFMETFFSEPLNDGRFETSLQTIRDKERTNHPERFDGNGNYTYHLPQQIIADSISDQQPPPIKPKFKFLTDNDSDEYAEGAEVECWQYPWLPKASIIQLFGYSGHGKSMFLQHALHHIACNMHFGPFRKGSKVPKIMYLDFENGRATWGRRVKQLKNSFGKSEDHILYWTPWSDNTSLNLSSSEGINTLVEMLQQEEPDILVIDTLRSAFPELQENNSEDWSAINQLAIKIRNAGCTVILVHHANKPPVNGSLGREAGSSNQLTTLETQVRITQVFEDKDIARDKGGIYSGDLASDPFDDLRQEMSDGCVLTMVVEMSYGKVREWTERHRAKQYIGYAKSKCGNTEIVGSRSPQDELALLIKQGKKMPQIRSKMEGCSDETLQKWAEEMEVKLPD